MERITDIFQKMERNGDDSMNFNELKVRIIHHIMAIICSTKLLWLVRRKEEKTAVAKILI
jgi:hypothetical protein